MKRILITGGRGFIGRYLYKLLCESGFEVVTLGRHQDEDISVDLADESLSSHIERINPNLICHLAGGTNIQNANDNPEKEHSDVVLSTKNLINSIKKSNCKIEDFIYLSSQAVYADSPSPIKEESNTVPTSKYGEYKLEAENMIFESGLPTTILRASSIYGAGQTRSGVVANFLKKIESGEPPVIFNSLDDFVDLIYVEDVVSCIKSIIEAGNFSRGIYNLSSGSPITLGEIIDELYKYFPNAKSPIIEENLTYKLKSKGRYLSVDKLKNQIVWRCKYNIEQGIKESIKLRKETTV